MYVELFNEKNIEEWDDFILKKSINGTFLQTRKFLNYHPKDRFVDYSLVVYDDNRIAAVVPACVNLTECSKELFSHKGSTYGGIVVDEKHYRAETMINIVHTIDDFCKDKFDRIILKITPDIYSKDQSDLLQYALLHEGYSYFSELNTYIDLRKINQDVISNFDRNKVRNIRKCEQHNLIFKEIFSDKEIEDFYNLLSINLSKYNLKPIHTLKEIFDLKNIRIPNNIKFYGVFKEDEMMAGGMMFVFNNSNVIHAQNLSADYRFTEYSPITFLYYKIIEKAKEDGYDFLTWGISTEDKGQILNYGLIRNKESYGSKYQLNRTFYKDY